MKNMVIDLNPNNFPEIYTDKIILAVWPYAPKIFDTREQYLQHNGFMFNYCDPDSIKYSINLEDDGNGDSKPSTVFNTNWVIDYVMLAMMKASHSMIQEAYIVVDAYPEVIEELHKQKVNYTLMLPLDYNNACCMWNNISSGGPLPIELHDDKTFYECKMYLKQFAFRTIETNDPFYKILCHPGVLDQVSIKAIKHCAYKDTTQLRSKVSDIIGYRWKHFGIDFDENDRVEFYNDDSIKPPK